MPKYTVTVPFEALMYEALSGSATSHLPDTIAGLPGMIVSAQTEGSYHAELQVQAADIDKARAIAIERVEEFLALAATWNEGLRVRPLGVRATLVADEQTAAMPMAEIHEDGTTRYIHVLDAATVKSETTLSVVMKRRSVQFEIDALEWREQWPDWLRTALKLNHLAVVSLDVEPTLVLHYAALEVLTDAMLDNLTILQEKKLGCVKKRLLLNKIAGIFSTYGFNRAEAKRFEERITTTQSTGTVDRITAALSKYDITADKQDVDLVRKQRGRIAHGKTASDLEQLHKAADLAQGWVQEALQQIIRTRKWIST